MASLVSLGAGGCLETGEPVEDGRGAITCQPSSDAPVLQLTLVDFMLEKQSGLHDYLAEKWQRHFRRATGCHIDGSVVLEAEVSVPSDRSSTSWTDDPARAVAEFVSSAVPSQGSSGDLLTVLTDIPFNGPGRYFYFDRPVAVIFAPPAVGFFEDPVEFRRKHPQWFWDQFLGYKPMVADSLVHEVGHSLGLSHSCSQCISLSGEAAETCCDECANADDVMSYCRPRESRRKTNEFLTCTRSWLTDQTVPYLRQNPTAWPKQTRAANGWPEPPVCD